MTLETLVLGVVLTFGTSDGEELQLTVTLSKSASVSLDWGGRRVESQEPALRHTLRGLATPHDAPLRYRLYVGSEPPKIETVKPLGGSDPLDIGIYGDSRDGPGPHRVLLAALATRDPDVLVHSGDIVHQAGDSAGWIEHLAASLPLSSRVPVILSLGNHELWQPYQVPLDQRIDAVGEVLGYIPPPVDALAKELGVGPQIFHVRIGRALFVSLDSNQSLAADQPQLRFLARVLEEKGDAFPVIVSLHHGPISSAHHGGHPQGASLIELAERHHVTLVVSGHDHCYERIVHKGVSYVVSGGGGAPLYEHVRFVPGSVAFASTYNWVVLTVTGEKAELEAYALEGSLLDRATLPAELDPTERSRTQLLYSGLAGVVLLAGLVFAAARLVLARQPGSG